MRSGRTGPSSFRVNDVRRAWHALLRVGVSRPQIEFVKPDGSKIVLTEQPEPLPPPPTAPSADQPDVEF